MDPDGPHPGAPQVGLAVPVLLLLLAGCSPPPDRAADLAHVDYWPAENALFIASRNTGHVDVLRVPRDRPSGLEYVQRLENPSRRHVVRLVVDRERSRVWVSGRNNVEVYTYAGGIRSPSSHTIPLADASLTISDLTLDTNGNAFIYIGGGTRIHRIDGITLAMEKWLEPFGHMPVGGSSTRALHTRDHRQLLLQSPVYGDLARIDVQSKKTEYIELNPPIHLHCGVLFWGAGSDSIKAIDCLGRWTAELDLPHDGRKAVARLNQGK